MRIASETHFHHLVALTVATALWLCQPPAAQADGVDIALSTNRVQLGSSPAELVLFGQSQRGRVQRIAVELEGPEGFRQQILSHPTLLTPTVFRSGIALPFDAPVGSYAVNVSIYRDDTLIASQKSTLEVARASN